MQSSTIVLIVTALIAILAVAWLLMQKRRSESLRHKFGPEYDRAVKEHGGLRKAEAVLGEREKRVENFHIVPLGPVSRDRFAAAWKAAQARFVDSPKDAIRDADLLVADAMRERGYPIGDFEQRAADISVDHPRVVENYRRAHAIAVRCEREGASTEDLRNAMVHYRSLFEDLLETPVNEHAGVNR